MHLLSERDAEAMRSRLVALTQPVRIVYITEPDLGAAARQAGGGGAPEAPA